MTIPRRIRVASVALMLLVGWSEAVRAADPPQYPAFGSSDVPLDSWVYPAFDRLISAGYAPTAYTDLRPWTRQECARLIEEAGEQFEGESEENQEVEALYRELEREFAQELSAYRSDRNRALRLESVSTRVLGISGQPLTDGFHFGQTIVNDFGRPYQEGINVATGVSAWAVRGRLYARFQGEYQHAPGAPALPQNIRQLIADVDSVSILPAQAIPTVNRFRLLDTYVGINLRNVQISFGKQSLWWGPGESGSLNFGNNAEPIYMLRISQVTPRVLPSFLKLLGPIRNEMFFGKVSGHVFPARPWIFGQKLVVKPTPNLEIGVSRTALFAGEGVPLTPKTFLRVMFSVRPDQETTSNDPGDRRLGLDFKYRLPKLRKHVTLYMDTMTDDDLTALEAPRNAVYNPGIHIVNLPRLEKFEFRFERVFTPTEFTLGHTGLPRPNEGNLVYWNQNYHNGYTHLGNLLGSWVGRNGQGLEVWARYWLSARKTVELGYRHAGVHGAFIPGGGRQDQIRATWQWLLRPGVEFSGMLQHERWNFPVLSDERQSNFTAGFQFTYWPRLGR